MPGIIYFFVTKCEHAVAGPHHLADFAGNVNPKVGVARSSLA
jgi:hypothetical protein